MNPTNSREKAPAQVGRELEEGAEKVKEGEPYPSKQQRQACAQAGRRGDPAHPGAQSPQHIEEAPKQFRGITYLPSVAIKER